MTLTVPSAAARLAARPTRPGEVVGPSRGVRDEARCLRSLALSALVGAAGSLALGTPPPGAFASVSRA